MDHDVITPLRVAVSWDGPVATITVAGELDLLSTPELAICLLEVAGKNPARVILDLDGLIFTDVRGATALHRAHLSLDHGYPVDLRYMQPPVRRVFQLLSTEE